MKPAASSWFERMGLLPASLARLLGRFVPPRAMSGQSFSGLTDPALLDYIRSGGSSPAAALQVSAVFRCVSLLSESVAMLPLRLMQRQPGGIIAEATGHSLHAVISAQPNTYQSAFDLRHLLQKHLLVHGNGYARIIRSSARISALLPIAANRVTPKISSSGVVTYRVETDTGETILAQADVLHIRVDSDDGLVGVSRLKMAEDSVGLSRSAMQSLSRIYARGVSAGGALIHPAKLSPDARANIRSSLENYSGSANAGKWMLLEEGIAPHPFGLTAVDAETNATRAHQVEDIARFFGIPRPLLGMDDTSWGSGIEQLAILFVRFALMPYLNAWEQALDCALLTRQEKQDGYYFDFDERELLRGSMKDQGEFFARALGSGGHQPWATPNEIRKLAGESPHPDGDRLAAPASQGPANVAPSSA